MTFLWQFFDGILSMAFVRMIFLQAFWFNGIFSMAFAFITFLMAFLMAFLEGHF
jgi:hypothetical protein